MSRFLPTLITILMVATLLPGIAVAQDEEPPQPPTIFVTSWMCDRGDAMDGIIETAEARELPIYQELVNEGQLWSHSVMVHHWGDEWNYVTITLADDVAAGLAANEAFGQRYEERHGEDDGGFIEHCRTHRDNIYVGAYTTTDNENMTPETPYSVALSYFACPFDMIDDVVNADRATFLPAAQASVDAGMGYWTGAMRHAWADEWTYIIVRSAKDVPSLLAFAEDTGNRIEEGGAEGGPPSNACGAHKDNIYQVVMETAPRPE